MFIKVHGFSLLRTIYTSYLLPSTSYLNSGGSNMQESKRFRGTRLAALLLCLALAFPIAAHAENEKTVRVGWYESPFNQTDSYGRRSGYAYEYQQKIAAYTGWTYEYVKGSWSELMQMLIDGEIDLMGDISYTVGRARNMLFSMVPMGTEEYYVFVASGRDSGIDADDYSSFNGKKIGVNKGSVQADIFRNWIAKKGAQPEIVELMENETESVELLKQGALDAFITYDGYGGSDGLLPVCKIGSSDFYFAVSKARPELLGELDAAMLRIQNENIYYNQQLQEKYLSHAGANMFFAESELNWLAQHRSIRVGYRDNYLAFCARDKQTGELTGALKEFLKLGSHCIQNSEIIFEPVAYPSTEDALTAMRRGEIDCVFPVNLSLYDAEEAGILMTDALMPCEMYAVVRASALREFTIEGRVKAAVNEGNPSYESFLMDHFPEWERVYFKDTAACLKGIAEGKADCLIVSNYRINTISNLLDEYKLSTVTTGVTMNSYFALNRHDSDLFSILNKVIRLVPSAAVNAALVAHSYADQQITFAKFIREHFVSVLIAAGIVVAVILALLLRSVRSERKTREAMGRIAELNTTLSDSQQKLKEALDASEQASRAKTSFLSNMSHEIRTPMNAIIGLDSIALRDQDLAPHTREQLEKIGSSAKHLLGIINDILDMSRIESGRMALKEEEFGFRDFLDQINVMINGQCVDKGLRFECHIIGHTEDYYVGDDMKLKQVLINILGNAVKFTPAPGSVTFSVEQIRRFEQHCMLRFIIRDTGIGMSKDYIPKIFEAFSQENDGSSTKYGSTGLGMAITKSIVGMMNGEIAVDSEKGKGSTFTVTVTLKVSACSEKDHRDLIPAGMRALVLDDDAVACEHEQLVADAVGIQADTVRTGEAALRMIREKKEAGQPYQLVLTDYLMPGMDGLAFTRALRKMDGGETGVILLTGYDWEDKQEEAKNAGVDVILSKPLFKDSLIHSVQNILLQREKAEDAAQSQPAAEGQAVHALEGCRILVVEDMELNAEILMDLLEMESMQSEHAENGQLAVDMFAAHPAGYYDAILMDVRMPVMNGLDATRAIRALDRPDAKAIPIIAMTANAFDEDVQHSLQAGMDAHLSKPVEPEQLYGTLDRMIHRK